MASEPLRETTIDQLRVGIYADNETLGRAAAELAAATIDRAIADRGVANVVLATGNSQISFLRALRGLPGIRWPAINVFHMDEYLDLPPGHQAGFPLFLRKHLLDHVPFGEFFPVPGHPSNVEDACRGYELLLRAHPADLCCMGIGENGHLAFNDPPGDSRGRTEAADFDDPRWVKVVVLDERSRRQQVGEGHFASLDEVPLRALTLTIPALRSAQQILCIVPERRKAEAVQAALRGPISPACPASILRQTPRAHLLLDTESSMLSF
ncbi:MAG TPA: glucosamine-6-phosphate deaminase [Chloroflexota bacterium]|nr:glucosamine-6-phosphate deaminase [Chloroflexota bacterium]